MKAWPSAKHFTSWLCLAPGNKISGGKVLSSRTRRSSSRAAALLRLAATTVGRSDTALGAFYRRLSSRAGKSKAVTATARKIAVWFYNTLRHGMSYKDPGAEQYEQQYRNRVLSNLQRRAKSLGFVLQAIPEGAKPHVAQDRHRVVRTAIFDETESHVRVPAGWLYLATILNLYSRRIVGCHLRADLPLAALKMAISAQRPGAGLIHHSDRGKMPRRFTAS
jgi:transposase InsO family protein